MEVYIFIVYFILRTVSEPFVQPKTKKNRSPNQWDDIAAIGFMVISFYIAGLYDIKILYQGTANNRVLFVFALMLAAGSYVGRIWAMRKLSTAYSRSISCNKDGKLITTGIYSKIRHPLYALYLIEMIAFILIKWAIIPIIAFIIVFIATLYRVYAEEKELTKHYGQEYSRYRRTTKYIIPYIW